MQTENVASGLLVKKVWKPLDDKNIQKFHVKYTGTYLTCFLFLASEIKDKITFIYLRQMGPGTLLNK